MNRSAAISALRHFAHEECANCPRPGECIMLKSGACLLTQGRRCGYFEDGVLQIAVRRLRLSRKIRPVDDTRVVTAYQVVHRETRGTLIAEPDDDGIETRRCPDCGGAIAARMRFCPECTKKRRRNSYRAQKAKMRRQHPERARERASQYRVAHPDRKKAGNAVARALSDGRLVRQPCEVCGSNISVQAHHDDYTKPLEVRWLCAEHHAAYHHKKQDTLSTVNTEKGGQNRLF